MRSKISILIGSMLCAVAVVLVGVGISYAHSPARSAQTGQHSPNLSAARGPQLSRELAYQNTHLFKATSSQARQNSNEPAIRIRIPSIAVDSPVIETVPVDNQWQVADWAVGHLSTTANPGGSGVIALAGHDDIKGEIFKRLGELKAGDKVLVYTQHREYTYAVTRQDIVDPSDSQVLQSTSSQSVIKMITCTPYWVDGQRIIVSAVLQSSRPR